MRVKDWLKNMPDVVTVDEVFVNHGEFNYALGHTAGELIYWNKMGEAHVQRRDTTRQFSDMKEELYSACFVERDCRYDLTDCTCLQENTNQKQK